MSGGPYWDRPWNWARGCSHASAGCNNCWAEGMATRFSREGLPFHGLVERGRWTGAVRFIPEALAAPLHARKPQRWFMDMSDPFHESLTNEQIAAAFGVAAACPQHTFIILTKRAARMAEWGRWVNAKWDEVRHARSYNPRSTQADICTAEAISVVNLRGVGGLLLKGANAPWPLPNVWLGVTVENQAAADERIPLLLQTPAAVRFLSCEPLLERVDLDMGRCEIHDRDEVQVGDDGEFCNECAANGYGAELSFGHWLDPLNGGIDWVIVGGESGTRARPFDLAWARSIRDQCRDTGVACFVKQMGAKPRWNPDAPDDWWKGPHTDRWGSPRFADRAGADPAEWPEDLRVREMPEGGGE